MELYQEMLIQILSNKSIQVTYSKDMHIEELMNSAYYKTLCKIKEILEDTTLDDPECFLKIEKIVQSFEDIGSNCGARHDF